MTKPLDLSKAEKAKFDSEVSKGLTKIGMSDFEYEPVNQTEVADFGLCSDCKLLYAASTKYGRIYAYCAAWDKQLSGSDLIDKCNKYEKKGQLTIYDMKEIALIINPNKNKIGF